MKKFFNKEAIKKSLKESKTYEKITTATSFIAGGIIILEPITGSILLASSFISFNHSAKLKKQENTVINDKKEETSQNKEEKTNKAQVFSYFKPRK